MPLSWNDINTRAAERMGLLHDQMRAVGYAGHALELYLVRLLFCLFAEDTGIFDKRQLHEYIEQRTAADGLDLAYHIDMLFFVLNTPHEQRLKNLDEAVAAFPFINGKLFATRLPPAGFDSAMRESLLELCAIDWSLISPAIFGSLFQSIMDKQARRNLGAHYTSEENILKLIKPLFLDDLWAEFAKISKSKPKLAEFHKKLRTLNFLDPACGCGNFLVITYRELRLLELEILRVLRDNGQLALDVKEIVVVDVDQFHGIEIEDFPAQIAQVALWLTDHQMNLKVSQEFGTYFVRIPLLTSANIVHGNALQLDWNGVLLCTVPEIGIGNKPIDGGHYLFTGEEKAAFLTKEPSAAPFFRRRVGADEFVSGYERRCLWLGDCPPEKLRAMPEAMLRVQAVKAQRLASKSAPTRKLAETPTRFHVENMPDTLFILIPETSSENRRFIPIGFESPTIFCSNAVRIIRDANMNHFGMLTSSMHNGWMKAVCGRLGNGYRYSISIVYNNYPWPVPTDKQRTAIESAAQGVLDARAVHTGASLADLYDPLTMPINLLKAHQQLDHAVDIAYGYTGAPTDAARVAFLFELYQKLTNLLPAEKPVKKAQRKPKD